MTSCYLCKHAKSKEYTVRGYFDKTKLNGQFPEIPDEVDVHISCSLLLKENSLVQVNGNWEIRGLEESLRFNNHLCQCCRKPFDYRNSPFIIYCHHNDCFDPSCKGKDKQCQKRHCAFTIDLGCIYGYQVYDILESNDAKGYKLKLFCIKHSAKRLQNSNMNQIQEQIIQKFFTNYQPQQQYNPPYQMIQQPSQVQQGTEFLQPQPQQSYDSNAYNNSNQVQQHHFNPQQQQQQQSSHQQNNIQYGGVQGTTTANPPTKGATGAIASQGQYNQGIIQGQQQYQQGPPNQQQQYQKQYNNPTQNMKYQHGQQQIPQQGHQPINNPSGTPHIQGDNLAPQYDQQSQQVNSNVQQKKNYDYQNNQPSAASTQQTPPVVKYDAQGRLIQQYPQQGGVAQNPGYDYNQQDPMYQQQNLLQSEGYNQQQLQGKNQKPMHQPGQMPPQGNQFPKNTQPGQQNQQWNPQTGTQQSQQQQFQSNQGNNQSFYSRGPSQDNAPYQPKQYDNYGQNQFQPDEKQTQNQNNVYNNPSTIQNNKTQVSNQDYNNAQNQYQPFNSNQSGGQNFNGSYNNSKYQSAAFPEQTPKTNNDQYMNQQPQPQQQYDGQEFNQQDRNQYKQQHNSLGRDNSIPPQQISSTHDNTYSFANNIPPPSPAVNTNAPAATNIPPNQNNKIIPQDYTQNNHPETTQIPKPAQPIYITNAAGKKILNPNVDTNPNGISVDITDQIQIKRFQQTHKSQQFLQNQALNNNNNPPAENQQDPNMFQRNTTPITPTGPVVPSGGQQMQIEQYPQQQIPPNPQGGVMKNPEQLQQNKNLQHQPLQQQQYYQKQPQQAPSQYPPTKNQVQPPVQQPQNPQSYNSGAYNANYQQQGNPYQNPPPQQQGSHIQQQQFQQSGQNQIPMNPNQLNNTGLPPQPVQQQPQTPTGMQNNMGYQQVQDKSRIPHNQLPPSRQWSQQSQQSTSQQQQSIQTTQSTHPIENSGANFGVPQYRRQSQQQIQQPQQTFQQVPGQYGQQNMNQFNQNTQSIQYNSNPYNNGQNQLDNKQTPMQIEESLPSTSTQNIDNSSAIVQPPAAAPQKKRGAQGKRAKKGAEEPAPAVVEETKPAVADVPLKHTKQVKQKLTERKSKKKQNTVVEPMEVEKLDSGAISTNPQPMDSSMFQQQPQPNIMEDSNIPNQINNLPPQINSENNITNKIESQDSMDFQSQTSLGNQVQRQNLQNEKQKALLQKGQLDQFGNNPQMQQQPGLIKQQSLYQQPIPQQQIQQNIIQQENAQNIIPGLAKQHSNIPNQQLLERQASLHQNPEIQQVPHIQDGLAKQNQNSIVPPLAPNQVPPHMQIGPRNLKVQQQFPQGYIPPVAQNPPQPQKIKSGPLVNSNYKPYFVDIIDIAKQKQQNFQYQQQMFKQQYMMQQQQHQQPHINGMMKQQHQFQQPNGQIVSPHPHMQQHQSNIAANVPYNFSLNGNQQNYNSVQVLNQANNGYVQNGQPQLQKQLSIQTPTQLKQIDAYGNPIPVQQQQQQFAQPNSAVSGTGHPASTSKDFKNESGTYHQYNFIQNQGNKENNS